MTRVRSLVALCLVPLVTAGCGSDDESRDATTASAPVQTTAAPVQLDATTRTATIVDGGTVELTIGEVNASIGDNWQLTNVEPAGSVTIADTRYEDSQCPQDGAGCSEGTLIWALLVTGDGTVTFDADNCYRGTCPGEAGAEEEAERRSYTLTVEG